MTVPVDLALWSQGPAALIAGAIAGHLLLGWRGGVAGSLLIAVTGLSAAWAAFALVAFATPGSVWGALAWVCDALRAGAACALVVSLLGGVRRVPGLAAVAGGMTLAALALIAALIWGARPGTDRLLSQVFLGLAVTGLSAVEQLWRNLPRAARWAAKPLCLALAASFSFDLYAWAEAALLGRPTPDAFVVRGFVLALCAPLLWLYGARNPGLRLGITVSRRVVFHSAALTACGAYLLLMSAAGFYVRDFGGRWGPALQLLLVFAGALLLVVIAASGAARAWLRLFVARHFFRLRYDYRDVWLGFTRALSQAGNHREAGAAALCALADLVESPGGALWWCDEHGDFLPLATHHLAPIQAPLSAAAAAALACEGVCDLTDAAQRHHPLKQQVPHARLLIPLLAQGVQQGFVVLAQPRVAIDINWEVRGVLATAAAQAASDIGHWQAFDALRCARRFEATSRMGTYVLHDLKNRVAELTLLLDNATRHGDKPAFQADMLRTISHTRESLRGLIERVRAAGERGTVGEVLLAAVLRDIAQSFAHRVPAPSLVVQHDARVRADVTTLARALGHLMQNAIDATDANGRVWVNLNREAAHARIEIHDTGAGMSAPFLREQLFKPFQTTKPQGMGIGAFESQQTIRDLGGRIEVDSRPGEGTCFTVWIPLAPATQGVAA